MEFMLKEVGKMNRFRVVIFFVVLTSLTTALHAGREWRSGTPMHTPRHGASVVVLGDSIYVLGGATTNGTILNTVERYDPSTRTWDNTGVAAFNYPRLDASAVVYDGKIVLAGGLSNNNDIIDDVEVYDIRSNSWSSIDDMRRRRRGHVLTLINGLPCAFAGIRDNNEFVEEMEWYDPGRDDWEETPEDFPLLLVLPFHATLNNSIYMFGGIFNFPTDSALVGTAQPNWVFNWQPLPSLQVARGNGATAVLGDSIFIMGGVTENGTATDLVEKYVISSGQLTTGPTLPAARVGMSAVTYNDAIYLIGGYQTNPNQPLADMEIYDLLTGIPGAGPAIPEDFAQITGYPNPFNGVITLEVDIPARGENEVTIYNTLGQKVKTLFSGSLTAGTHTMQWDARDESNRTVGSGLYLAVLRGPGYLQKMKVIYVK